MWPRLFLFLSLLCFANCKQKNAGSPRTTLPTTNSGASILNNIVVHESGGLQIARAFLAGENGNLLNAENKVQTGEAVYLTLIVNQGWIAVNGKSSLGATQTIETADGEPVLSSPDLFAGVKEIEEEKAGQLRLQTTLTKTRADTKQFVIRYKVWDKNGPAEVNGYYRLVVADSVSARQ